MRSTPHHSVKQVAVVTQMKKGVWEGMCVGRLQQRERLPALGRGKEDGPSGEPCMVGVAGSQGSRRGA